MGFQFLFKKPSLSITSNTSSLGSKRTVTHESGGGVETGESGKLTLSVGVKQPISRRLNMLNKLTLRRNSTGCAGGEAGTPPGNSPTTPLTTLLRQEAESVFPKRQQEERRRRCPVSEKTAIVTKTFDLKYQDCVTHTVLEERERIRQQLFYEQEGVEVSAQFHHRGKPTTAATPTGKSMARQMSSFSKCRSGVIERCDVEQEQTGDSTNSVMIVSPLRRMTKPPSGKNQKDKSKNKFKPGYQPHHQDENGPPLQSIPALDDSDSERDPIVYFPAIAAAVGKTKESQIKRNASLTSKTSNASSSSSSVDEDSTLAATLHKNRQDPLRTEVTNTLSATKSAAIEEVTLQEPVAQFTGDLVVETGTEDPTILELEGTFSKDDSDFNNGEESNCSLMQQCTRTTDPMACSRDGDVTLQMIDAFSCGVDNFTESSWSAHRQCRSCRLADVLYDNSSWTCWQVVDMKRSYYNEAFAQRFLKDVKEDGLNLLWHLPPSCDDAEAAAMDAANWSGRSVVMKIRPGSCYSNNDVEPRLAWTTVGGGTRGEKITRCSISLLRIQSVAAFRETVYEQRRVNTNKIKENDAIRALQGLNTSQIVENGEDVCLFAVTSNKGDVQVFEAASPRERDLFVTGLRNVIARLSFHVTAGDAGSSSEPYYEEDADAPMDELPSIASPLLNMNRIAHILLDY